MFYVPPYETAVTLFGSDGSVRIFCTRKEAYRVLGFTWIRNHVGANFREHAYTVANASGKCEAVFNTNHYIMRDDSGEALTAADFAEFRPKYVPMRNYMYGIWNGEGPVPGVSKPKAGGHYYRRMRTMAERRQATPVYEEGEVAPRASRSAHNLPNNWDDKRISSAGARTWKRHRKTQYKEAVMK